MLRAITTISLKILTIFSFFFISVPSLEALQLTYRLKVGFTYVYELKQRSESELISDQMRFSHPAEFESKLEILVLAFRDGVYVLDILSNGKRIRRYMKPNGEVMASPDESATGMPFFSVLPDGEAVVGQTRKQNSILQISGKALPATLETSITSFDKAKNTMKITLVGSVALASDRVTARVINTKGTMLWSLEKGCPEEAEWTLTYNLNYGNKEIAVIRELWQMRETKSTTCKLIGVKP